MERKTEDTEESPVELNDSWFGPSGAVLHPDRPSIEALSQELIARLHEAHQRNGSRGLDDSWFR